MSDPTPRLDERFSDPGTTPTPWAEVTSALERAELSWITTVRGDGRPHVTPLVAVWLEDTLYFCTGPEEQKAINLAGNDAVVLTTGCNEWDGGLDVMVEGRARRVTDRARLERLARAWTGKWDGRWQFDVTEGGFGHDGGGTAFVYAVVPTKVLAFGKAPFTHTRFRAS